MHLVVQNLGGTVSHRKLVPTRTNQRGMARTNEDGD